MLGVAAAGRWPVAASAVGTPSAAMTSAAAMAMRIFFTFSPLCRGACRGNVQISYHDCRKLRCVVRVPLKREARHLLSTWDSREEGGHPLPSADGRSAK